MQQRLITTECDSGIIKEETQFHMVVESGSLLEIETDEIPWDNTPAFEGDGMYKLKK